MAAKFKVGDQVQLISGGPVMTVDHIKAGISDRDRYRVRCVWFAGKKQESTEVDQDTLVKAEKKQSEIIRRRGNRGGHDAEIT